VFLKPAAIGSLSAGEMQRSLDAVSAILFTRKKKRRAPAPALIGTQLGVS
jgi:hypothetical protein